jgi:hypothetical protein
MKRKNKKKEYTNRKKKKRASKQFKDNLDLRFAQWICRGKKKGKKKKIQTPHLPK